MILSITIAGEPKAMERPRMGKQGRFYTPKTTLEYEATVAWEARAAKTRFGQREVVVHTDFFCKTTRKPDGDNMHKAVLDALEKAEVYDNDSQVLEGHYRVFRSAAVARTEIRVYSLDQTTV